MFLGLKYDDHAGAFRLRHRRFPASLITNARNGGVLPHHDALVATLYSSFAASIAERRLLP